jgi:amidophosphoribosyltransferase
MCGIGAVYFFDHSKHAAPLLYQMLLSQDNRMNYSAGITVFDENRKNDFLITADWGIGSIDTAFGLEEERKKRIDDLEGYLGIAQGRYATSNSNRKFTNRQKRTMAQPYRNIDDFIAGTFSFGFNGNIANYPDLYDSLKNGPEGYHIRTETDTEVVRILLKKGIKKALKNSSSKVLDEYGFKDILSELDEKLIGAYSLVFMDGTGNLLLARDKEGTRPFVYTIQKNGLFAASEPTAFNDQGIHKEIHDVKPGHFLLINRDHTLSEQIAFSKSSRAHCGFDPEYFSHVTSIYDGIKIQKFRMDQGGELAVQDKDINFTLNDFIAPVPETARVIADGYVQGCIAQGRVPPTPLEALIKHKHFRNFMEDNPESRREKIKHKFRQTWGIAKGKNLYLVDDSQVRGDVLGGLIPIIWDVVQPVEIHIRIAWDQFKYPCFRGIDVPESNQLISSRFDGDVERIREFLGVTSLKFLPISTTRDLLAQNSSGKLTIKDFCTACVDGNYPSDYEKKLAGLKVF